MIILSRRIAVITMLLTSALFMIFPVNLVPLVQVIIELWRDKDYAFIVGILASIALGVIRNPLVGAISLVLITFTYHIMRRVKVSGGLGPLWALTLLSLIVMYYSNMSWGVINFADTLRRWWEGSKYPLAPVYLTLAFSCSSVAYSLALSEGGNNGPFSKIRNYLKDNLGVMPVLAFMASLISAAVYLALGYEGSANKLAELAYYFLVIGVGLQIYEAVKSKGRGVE